MSRLVLLASTKYPAPGPRTPRGPGTAVTHASATYIRLGLLSLRHGARLHMRAYELTEGHLTPVKGFLFLFLFFSTGVLKSVKCFAIALGAASELSREVGQRRAGERGAGGRVQTAAIRQMLFVPASSHTVSAAVARCIIGLQAREKFVCVARALGTRRRGGWGRVRGRRGNAEGILVRVQYGTRGATAAMRARVHYICGEDEVRMPIRAVEPE
ncbi:hypothetical protein K438DRAFT_1778711 [Mycena galopus ATCC 62051]|nr:hypothetical protein K438DRAFT_1778711 [Mycena galopus ATCC 62051]